MENKEYCIKKQELWDEWEKVWKEYREIDAMAEVVRKEYKVAWDKYYNHSRDKTKVEYYKKCQELWYEYLGLWEEYLQISDMAEVVRQEASAAWKKYYNYEEDENGK